MAEQRPDPDPANDTTECGRDPLIDAITMFLARDDVSALSEIRESLEREIDQAGPDALVSLSHRLANSGADWNYYPQDPLAKRIHHLLADRILAQDPILFGTEHLASVVGEPLVIFANHLSYSDANVLEVVFERAGASALSDRLTVVAGPKVYSSLKRRFSSLCFGTIKTPQNIALSTDEAVMNIRDVALAARRSIQIARERLRLGEALLIFAEGTRSRSGEMQPLLAGVARYLDEPDSWVLPVGITGSEALFPIGADSLTPVRVVTRVGRPIRASRLRERARRNRRLIVDCIGLAIAALLPPDYRGAYGDQVPDLDNARRVLRETFG